MIAGGTNRDATRISRGLTELASKTVDAAADAFRDGLIDPLLARISVRGTGDDFADVSNLLDTLTDVFDDMDDEALVEILAAAVAQAGIVGIASVAPDPDKLAELPEVIEPTASPFEEVDVA